MFSVQITFRLITKNETITTSTAPAAPDTVRANVLYRIHLALSVLGPWSGRCGTLRLPRSINLFGRDEPGQLVQIAGPAPRRAPPRPATPRHATPLSVRTNGNLLRTTQPGSAARRHGTERQFVRALAWLGPGWAAALDDDGDLTAG